MTEIKAQSTNRTNPHYCQMSSWGSQSAFGTKPPPGVRWPFLSHREEQQDTTHTSLLLH